MEFRLLGPVEVADAGNRIAIGAPKERILLAALLVHANEVVSVDRLIDYLWPLAPPVTAGNTLQAYVSRLRKALGGDRIVTQPPGYFLAIRQDEFDVTRFETLTVAGREALARGDAKSAAEQLRRALALWRGDALAEFRSEPFLQAEVARLEEEHATAREDRIDADLALGRHSELVGELESLVAANPVRERLRGQLMLALYRSGRQAEALEAYRTGRQRLVNDFGLEPGPPLQRLQTAILLQDTSLELVPTRVAAAPAAPALPMRDAVRKRATVFFTRISIENGHAASRARIHSRALKKASEILEYHGARLQRGFAADLVGIFGLPGVHEDDALRAIRAAIEVRRAMKAMSEDLLVESDVHITTRIGIGTVDIFSANGELIETNPLDEVARLTDTATDGEILIGNSTRVLVNNAVRTARVQGARYWRVLEVHDSLPLVPRQFDRPIVGRHNELEQLLHTFANVEEKAICHMFTIVGEAGIGKSRLARELIEVLGDRAAGVVGRCLPYGEGITYWPVREIITQLAGDTTAAALLPFLSESTHAQSIAETVADLLGSPGTGGKGEDSFWAIRKLLERMARDRPLVLVIDDIHWAEATLLNFLEHFADWSRGVPILLLCLARPEFLDRRPSWGAGKLHSSSIGLHPLSTAAADTLLDQLNLGSDLSTTTRTQIATVAEGNPLFLEQIVALAADNESTASLSIPPTIQALLAARVDALSTAERAVLQRASVIGKEFTATAVARVGRSETYGPVDVILAQLIRKQLIHPHRSRADSDEKFRFSHILIRDTAYDSLPHETRATLHETFADSIEADYGDRITEIEGVLGHHLERAYRYRSETSPHSHRGATLAVRAARTLAAAGRRALRRSDIPAAISFLSRAASLFPSEHPDRGETLSALAFALRERGDWRTADERLQEARQNADARNDVALQLHLRLARIHHRIFIDPALTIDEIVRESSAALRGLSGLGHARWAATARSTLAWGYLLDGKAAAAEHLLSDLIAYAYRESDSVVLDDSQKVMLATWLYGPLAVPEATARCEEILSDDPAPRVEASALRYLGLLKAMNGDFDDARMLLARDSAILDELGLAVVSAAAREVHGVVDLLAGDAVAAENNLRFGLTTLKKLGERMFFAGVAAVLAQALCAQERYDEAFDATLLSEASGGRDVAAPVHWRGIRAKVLARRGDDAAAEQLAREATALAANTDFLDLRGESLMDLAEVLRLTGKLSESIANRRAALRLFEKKGNVVSATKARRALLDEKRAVA